MLRLSSSTVPKRAPLRAAVRHMSGKDVRFGNEARALMLAGVDKLADAVQVPAQSTRLASACLAASCAGRARAQAIGLQLSHVIRVLDHARRTSPNALAPEPVSCVSSLTLMLFRRR